ncbi:MAG: hypothetical protein IPH18_18140 [Chitinophagaceae bacterium]|nr:hypothetical protein [Chitinophagaceae bacterium]
MEGLFFYGNRNFNEATGRFYTDHVFFSTNLEFGKELDMLFTFLQSRTQPVFLVKFLLITFC